MRILVGHTIGPLVQVRLPNDHTPMAAHARDDGRVVRVRDLRQQHPAARGDRPAYPDDVFHGNHGPGPVLGRERDEGVKLSALLNPGASLCRCHMPSPTPTLDATVAQAGAPRRRSARTPGPMTIPLPSACTPSR